MGRALVDFRRSRAEQAAQIFIPACASAASFGLWAAAGHISSSQFLAPAVSIYTIGGSIWLVLGLGVSQVLPNALRPDRTYLRRPTFTLLGISNKLSIGLAGVAAFLAAFSADEAAVALMVGLAYGGLLAQASVAVVYARVDRHVWMAIAGSTITSPMLPALWLLAGLFTNVRGALVAASSTVVICSCFCAYWTANASKRRPLDTRKSDWTLVVKPLQLLPHLIAFSVISQGARLAAISFLPQREVLDVHYTVLLAGLGFTVLSTMQGVLAARMQSADEAEFTARRLRWTDIYGALGLASCAVFAIGAMLVAPVFFGESLRLSPSVLASLSSMFIAICAYYSLSNLFVRRLAFGRLSTASVSVASAYAIITIMRGRRSDSVDFTLALYALSFWCLFVFVFFLVLFARRVEDRAVLRRVALWVTPGIFLVVLGTASLV